MSLLEALKAMIPAEIIDGSDVEKTAEIVMLDIAFTPVVQHRHGGDDYDLLDNPPRPVQVEKRGERYLIVHPESHDFDWVDEKSLKAMRARFLLLRGFYYKRLRSVGHSTRQQILGLYFPEGVYLPAEGSELSKAMGLEPGGGEDESA